MPENRGTIGGAIPLLGPFVSVVALIKTWALAPFRYRSLFKGFVNQEIRGRYAGSIGGLVWSILTPLANMLIYIFIFSTVFQIRLQVLETGTESFVVFLLCGLLPWLAFAEALHGAPGVFLGKSGLITKVAFPLEILPLSGVAVTFLLHGIGFLIFLVYLVFQGFLHMSWLWLPAVIAVHMLFTLGVVVLLGSLSVFVRDIQQLLGVVVFLWFYLTPILYPVSMVPTDLRWIIRVNPMWAFIDLYRCVLLKHTLPWPLIAEAAILAMIAFMVGILFFQRARNAFADVL